MNQWPERVAGLTKSALLLARHRHEQPRASVAAVGVERESDEMGGVHLGMEHGEEEAEEAEEEGAEGGDASHGRGVAEGVAAEGGGGGGGRGGRQETAAVDPSVPLSGCPGGPRVSKVSPHCAAVADGLLRPMASTHANDTAGPWAAVLPLVKAGAHAASLAVTGDGAVVMAGLYSFVDSSWTHNSLKAPGFNPLHLKCDILQ